MIARAARSPSASRLRAWPPAFTKLTAVVWGDFILDEYWRCCTRRVSREAPVLVLDYESRNIQGGGAANAALNLAALGAKVAAVGWVGRDAHGRELRALLRAGGVETEGLLVHPAAATVVKTRIVAGDRHMARQQVVRVDRGAPFVAGASAKRALMAALDSSVREARAVVLSDYGYDAVTPELARARVKGWRSRRIVVGLDARYRLAAYRGVSVATPNESEAAQAAGIEIRAERDLGLAAARLRQLLAPRHLIITRGRDGLTLWGRGGSSLKAWGGEEAVDVTGAGDAVIATATLALAAGAPALEAAALANVAGSVAVSRRGAVAVSAADLERALRGAERGRSAR